MREYRIVKRPQITLCDVNYYIDDGNGDPWHDIYFNTSEEASEYLNVMRRKYPNITNAPIMQHIIPVELHEPKEDA